MPGAQVGGRPSDELLVPGKAQDWIIWGGGERRTQIPPITPTTILMREICVSQHKNLWEVQTVGVEYNSLNLI